MVFRDHITAGSRPSLFVKALVASEIRVDAAADVNDRPGVRVVDFNKGTTDTVTVTVDGAPTILTEGTEFLAATSNVVTAASIAAAITAVAGVTAQRIDDVIYVIPDAGVNTLTLATGDPEAWSVFGFTTPGTPQTLVAQETTRIDLPVGAFDPLNKVAILNVLRGKVSADLRSPIPVRSYFRMPTRLRATTGHPGGWPVGP
jgi:hypothetical protein